MGTWGVFRIENPSKTRDLEGFLYFESTRSSALERHLEKVSFDGGVITKITQEEGWHSTLISANGEHLLDSFSSTKHAQKSI